MQINITTIDKFLESKMNEIVKTPADYLKEIEKVKKLLLSISVSPSTGELYSEFTKYGMKYDDYGLKIKNVSISKEIGKFDKFLTQLEKEIRKVK